MTLGGGNFTSTLNLVGFSLGVTQLAPLEMAPQAGTVMVTSCLHMEGKLITSQIQVKAGHLLLLSNPRQTAARIISTSLSTKTGTPHSLSRH